MIHNTIHKTSSIKNIVEYYSQDNWTVHDFSIIHSLGSIEYDHQEFRSTEMTIGVTS